MKLHLQFKSTKPYEVRVVQEFGDDETYIAKEEFKNKADAREAYRLIQLVQGLLQKSKPAQVPARRDNFHGLERADDDVPSIGER